MIKNQPSTTGAGQTDGAALGSGVVGVAVAMLIEPGAFTPLVAIVAVSLAFVIFSYIGRHSRDTYQQIAFASVMGVLAIPVAGTILERDWQAKESQVDMKWLIGIWMAVSLMSLLIDTAHQHRLRKRMEEPVEGLG